MSRKTKLISMVVTVRVPAHVTAIQARREVRTLITEKTTYSLEHEEIRAQRVEPREARR